MVNIIVAIAENGVIGGDNTLLWHIGEDLKNFKKITSGHPVIMGRKTFESIGRPLPNRTNVVITRQNISIEGCRVAHSFEEAISLFSSEEEIFIIGGAQIYAQALPIATTLYLTRVHKSYEGDTSFPEWSLDEWSCTESQRFECGEKFEHPFTIEKYLRRFAMIPAGEESIPTIQRLAATAFPATYGHILGQEQLDFMMDWMYSTSAIIKQMESTFSYFLTCVDGQIVGYVAIEYHADDKYELQRLYLLPEMQGRGIGRKMIKFVFDHVRSIASSPVKVDLRVNRNNHTAIEFYKRNGMEIEREDDGDIGHGYFMNDYIFVITL
ncbi:MAG: dihydrofolate reductase [Rikenellaceae bacterium]